MKKLFVIYNTYKIIKEKNKDLSPDKIKSDKENNSLELDLPQSQSESTNLTQSPKTECQNNSRKNSLFTFSTSSSFSSNANNSSDLDNKVNEQNCFLGKKTKFHFNVTKESPQKIKQNNLKTRKSESILNQEKNEKNESLNLEEHESKEELKNKKEGRWSFEERIRFIEALIMKGKNWRGIQKYIGSRTCAQTRSHAQKLLLKLRAIENDEFNFKKESIKNLSDIVEEIKNKEGIKNIDDDINKKNILDKMLSLSGGNSNETKGNENYSLNNDNKKIIKFENLNSNLKTQIPINNNKNEKNNNNIEQNHNKNNNENKDVQNNNPDLYEDKNLKNECINNEISNEIEINNYIYNNENQKLVFDCGLVYYVDNNSIYDINNMSYYIKNYKYVRNIERF